MKNTFLMLSFYITFACAAAVFCASPVLAKIMPEPVAAPTEKPPEKPVRTSCGGGVEGDVVVKCGMG